MHYIIEKRKQKLITASPSSESGDSSITKLDCVNAFGKKDLLISFMKVTMKMKMLKCQKTIIQAIKNVTKKFLTFF